MKASPWTRIRFALRLLFDADFAARLLDAPAPALPEPADAPPPAPQPVAESRPSSDAALVLLSLLQREGRFVDFLMQDVDAFSDGEIGAVARVVHQGCRRALAGHVTLEPVRDEAEGNRLALDPGFDKSSLKLTGNVSGSGPYRGVLRHRGWRAVETNLPEIMRDQDVRVVAPAELEVQ